MKELFLYKGEALLPAIAYGDAAGLPVETRSAEYIQKNYDVIDRLIPTSENPFYLGNYEPGLWSDDTQLSLAVAQGLIDADGFDIQAQAQQHIHAYDSTPEMERKGIQVKRGWGGSTTAAMERLKAGVSPEYSGTEDGSGNGVLMKMAPLVYWQVARNLTAEERHEQYDALTTMTHDSDVARLMTRVHGDVLHSLMSEHYEKDYFVNVLLGSVGFHSSQLGLNPHEQEAIFSYLNDPVTTEAILAHTDRKGFYAPQTLAMAYGAFVAHEADTATSVFEAVNLGGDTDSTASIVAAMSVFAAEGEVRLPIDHQNIFELDMIQKVSRELAARALRR
jgi:ADP-ribosylglycohydrolase